MSMVAKSRMPPVHGAGRFTENVRPPPAGGLAAQGRAELSDALVTHEPGTGPATRSGGMTKGSDDGRAPGPWALAPRDGTVTVPAETTGAVGAGAPGAPPGLPTASLEPPKRPTAGGPPLRMCESGSKLSMSPTTGTVA